MKVISYVIRICQLYLLFLNSVERQFERRNQEQKGNFCKTGIIGPVLTISCLWGGGNCVLSTTSELWKG